MIENATITQIVPPPTTGSGGDQVYSAGSAVSYRCCVQAISRAVARMVDVNKLQVDTEMYIDLFFNPTIAGSIAQEARLTVQPDAVGAATFAALTFEVKRADTLIGALAAFRCLLRSL